MNGDILQTFTLSALKVQSVPAEAGVCGTLAAVTADPAGATVASLDVSAPSTAVADSGTPSSCGWSSFCPNGLSLSSCSALSCSSCSSLSLSSCSSLSFSSCVAQVAYSQHRMPVVVN